MNWLSNKINKWASGKQTEELEHFVQMLRGMDGPELGHVVALATNLRHGMERDGHNVMEPVVYTSANPGFVLLLSRMVAEAQKQGRMQDAAGLMVWTHTARAGVRLELRVLAKEMWRELARGFPHVVESARGFERTTGRVLRIQGAEQFPAGFTPELL